MQSVCSHPVKDRSLFFPGEQHMLAVVQSEWTACLTWKEKEGEKLRIQLEGTGGTGVGRLHIALGRFNDAQCK